MRHALDRAANAHEWMERVVAGISVADLAREIGMDDGEISRILPLGRPAPDIVEAILHGSQPVHLTHFDD